MSYDQRDQGHIPQKFEVIFVGFRLMNIIWKIQRRGVLHNISENTVGENHY